VSAASNAAEPTSDASRQQSVGFGSRGRARRRARFLRKARELAYRDLGGLVFSLHRFGQRNDVLVLAKLGTLSRIDAELSALEANLSERQPVTVLREAGITACPRCAAIHSGEDRFCPNCGLSMSRRSDLPIAGAASSSVPPAGQDVSAPAALSPTQAPSARATEVVATAPSTTPPPTPAPATQAQPTIAQPVPTPATQSFDAVPPVGASGTPGRAPLPPTGPSQTPAPTGEDDQPTEIIRPPASGS
jgi:hypothetical protein